MLNRLILFIAAPIAMGATQSESLPLSRIEIADYVSDKSSDDTYPSPLLDGWQRDLRAVLAHAAPDEAATAIAAKYHLSAAQSRELVRLWLYAVTKQYRSDKADKSRFPLVRARLLTLRRQSLDSSIVLEVAAQAFDDMGDNADLGRNTCSAADFDALLAGSSNPVEDAWRIANRMTCSDNMLRAIAVSPSHAAPYLARLLGWGSLPAPDRIAVSAYLASDEALAQVAPADRTAASAYFKRNYLLQLFATGRSDDAVAIFEQIPQTQRDSVLDGTPFKGTISIAGLPLTIDDRNADWSVRTNIAAAYAVAGRSEEAERIFVGLPYAAAAREAYDCLAAARSTCAGDDRNASDFSDTLALDRFLHHRGEDPYLFAEMRLSSMSADRHDGAMTELLCRYLADAQYAADCAALRAALAGDEPIELDPKDTDQAEKLRAAAAIAALRLPGYAETRARAAAIRAELVKRDAIADRQDQSPRASIAAEPPPFALLPLPERYRGTVKPAPWPHGVAALPNGFEPVRFARLGARAVAISLSQNVDPTGEVSPGGYWVHLSTDGGMSWQAPIYTGLADHFPYVVRPDSPMPLIDGDTLQLDVDVREIDTATITYPPVALRTRRKQSGLYLRIPLAELTRDSHGDGITDIEAHHLLLDGPSGARPFVVGSDPAEDCTAPASPDKIARIAAIAKLFDSPSGAIVEPVDRPTDAPLMSGWRSAPLSTGRPIFIEGDPADFRCIRTKRLMIVFRKDDLDRLRSHDPDFHAVSMPRIIFNRAHDRGYMPWSAGWTGGTYRLRLVDGKWVFDTIGSWIT